MEKRKKLGRVGLVAWFAICGATLAQTAPNNDQLVQSFRALLSSGADTQAVIQAVAVAVREALQQGPMTPAQVSAAQAPAGGSSLPSAGTTPAPAVTPPKSWTDAITLKGDVRYRVETRQDESKKYSGNPDIEYERLRARLGAEAKINDDVKAFVRLTTDGYKGTTAGGDPVSGNQDLTSLGSKKFIFLDQAYLDWNLFGEGSSELHALAGKMSNPFITMNDDLAWDPDLTPEGAALKGSYAVNDQLTLLGNGGYFTVNNQNGTNYDNRISMFGVQGAVRYEFIPEVTLTLGLSDYYYEGVEGARVVDWAGGTTAYGNSTAKVPAGKTSNTVYATGFNLIQPFAQLDLYPTICGKVLPVALFAQAINNLDAEQYNKGAMYGLSVGKAKNPQSFELGASYAKLEKDATFGAWTDSDRWGGGSDGSGYKLYAKYMIMKYLMGQITYFKDDKTISKANGGDDYNRWQFDLTASF
jgi:hypothetical protein